MLTNLSPGAAHSGFEPQDRQGDGEGGKRIIYIYIYVFMHTRCARVSHCTGLKPTT